METYQSRPRGESSRNHSLVSCNGAILSDRHIMRPMKDHFFPVDSKHIGLSVTAATESQESASSSEDTDASGLPKTVMIDKTMSFFVRWLDRTLGVVSPRRPAITVGKPTVKPEPPEGVRKPEKRVPKSEIIKQGCRTCKQRRVKCDMMQPECTNCVRLGMQCAGYLGNTLRIQYSKNQPRPVKTTDGTPSGNRSFPGNIEKSSAASTSSIRDSPQRQKRTGDSDQSNQDSGDDHNRRQGKRARLEAKTDCNEKAKLACPYYKHNPRKYRQQRPCCAPGWDHVHRIKEHLYRKHAMPRYSCHRCCERFEVEEDLSAHARAPEPCEVREPELHDGFNQAQEKRLRSRKKDRSAGAEGLTEAQKWRQMYQILFPDVREVDIPSPYYEDGDLNRGELGGFEDYLRRELPPLVRRQLEQEVERELNFVEEGLKRRVINMVQGLQLTLLQSYRKMEESEARQLETATSADPAVGPVGESSTSNGLSSPPPQEAVPTDQATTRVSGAMGIAQSFDPFNEILEWENLQSFPHISPEGLDFSTVNSFSFTNSYSNLPSDSGYISGGHDAEKAEYSDPEDPGHHGNWIKHPWFHG